ncbi:MAG: hypothetical protein ACOY82_15155 [Pseudomonadota bacterium]
MQLSPLRWFRHTTARVTLPTDTTTSRTPMLAFLRSSLARSFSARIDDACIASPDIGEGALERLHATPIAGLSAELREWLPVAWTNGDTGMGSSRCRA